MTSWEQRPARRERHEKLLADGYVLIKGDQREHPAHSEEFVARINALALYIGRGNYNPHTNDRRKLKRAQRLWNRAFSNYYLMTRDPTWWQTNASNQYSLVFPEGAEPPPATVPYPVYIKDGAMLAYQPFEGSGIYGIML